MYGSAIVMFGTLEDANRALSIDHEHLRVELKTQAAVTPSLEEVPELEEKAQVVEVSYATVPDLTGPEASLSPRGGEHSATFMNRRPAPIDADDGDNIPAEILVDCTLEDILTPKIQSDTATFSNSNDPSGGISPVQSIEMQEPTMPVAIESTEVKTTSTETSNLSAEIETPPISPIKDQKDPEVTTTALEISVEKEQDAENSTDFQKKKNTRTRSMQKISVRQYLAEINEPKAIKTPKNQLPSVQSVIGDDIVLDVPSSALQSPTKADFPESLVDAEPVLEEPEPSDDVSFAESENDDELELELSLSESRNDSEFIESEYEDDDLMESSLENTPVNEMPCQNVLVDTSSLNDPSREKVAELEKRLETICLELQDVHHVRFLFNNLKFFKLISRSSPRLRTWF